MKEALIDQYTQAINATQRTESLLEQIASLSSYIDSAADRLKVIREELARPPEIEGPTTATIESMSLAEVEARRLQAEGLVSSLRDQLSSAENALTEERGRPASLRDLTAASRDMLGAIAKSLESPAAPEDSPTVVEARRIALLARQRMRRLELRLYDLELSIHETRQSLLLAERDMTARNLAIRESIYAKWRTLAQRESEARAAQATRQAVETRKQAVDLPPDVLLIADENVTLSQDLVNLATLEGQVSEDLARVESQLKQTEEDYLMASKRVQAGGLTQPIGLLMRSERQSLPSLRGYRRSVVERRDEIRRVSLLELETDKKHRTHVLRQSRIDETLKKINPSLDAKVRDEMEVTIRKIIEDHGQLLDRLSERYTRYMKALGGLVYTEGLLVAKTEEYAAFIDERLLWIQSMTVIGPSDARPIADSILWAFRTGHFRDVAVDIWRSLVSAPRVWLPIYLGALMMVAFRRFLVRRQGPSASGPRQATPWQCALNVLRVAVRSMGWPMLASISGWLLAEYPGAGDMTRFLGVGLSASALLWASMAFVHRLCRKGGVGDLDFGWPEEARLMVRRQIRRLAIVLLPAVAITAGVEELDNDINRNLGRVAFLVAMAAVAWFFYRVLRPRGILMAVLARRNARSSLIRFRPAISALAVGAPLILMALSALGYHFAALRLAGRCLITVWLAIGLTLFAALASKWLALKQRDMAAKRLTRPASDSSEGGSDKETGDWDEAGVVEQQSDAIAEMTERTRALTRVMLFAGLLVGLAIAWTGVLPALSMLNSVRCWSYVTGAGEEQIVTLGNLALAVLIGIVTVAAARNFPYLLRILVLDQLNVEPGSSYAVAAICRYAIATVGVVVVFNVIGLQWSSIQWLVAAMSVGIGFGLQEVVANFICGLILLFERPVRVGDTVTVGDVSGTVTRIQMRATTITDWDRKELVVPNKEFITGQLVNWSLSDPIIRMNLPVGIAYGSDTALAERLLMKVARKNSLVLDDPEPTARFMGFGESSLDFSLRAFLYGVENRYLAQHQLCRAIDDEFRKAGICIAFPQRDVHFDADKPIDVRVVGLEGADEG